ncbi:uncharacterized protein LOC133814932 [Humulus lupulus]|uniref:uncharacterized protein LOC133814932 n=1 Tax=Humulus lupulus TaxID=3486 RepID=UPI002B403500|nr:uncharacterized protein LOC133814932 [Humulus lupulus]
MSSTTNEGINVSYIPHLAEEVADFIIEYNTKRKKKLEEIQIVISDYRVNTIEQGKIYKDKNPIKSALSYYAMLHNFQFKTKKSEPREYLVTCVDDTCSWFVRASKYKDQDIFKVRKCIPNHTFSVKIVMEDHRQAKSIVIGELIKNKYKSIKRNYTPNDIMKDMNDDYGVTMGYTKAWRSREKALRLVRGSLDDSYQKLQMYLYMLKQANPGTITHLLTDKEDRFKYLYIAFSNSIKANSENDNSWLWFFSKLRDTYGELEESLNVALKAARNLPIDILVESLRSLVQKWVWNNSNNANGTFTKVSTTIENELRHDIV